MIRSLEKLLPTPAFAKSNAMQKLIFLSLTIFVTFGFCGSPPYKTTRPAPTDTITRVEMNLSAFGVESDAFPSIDVLIDFTNDSSICKKSYYNTSVIF